MCPHFSSSIFGGDKFISVNVEPDGAYFIFG